MEDYNPYRKCCEQTMSLWDRFAIDDDKESKCVYIGADVLEGKCPAQFIRYKESDSVDLAEELLTLFNKTESDT